MSVTIEDMTQNVTPNRPIVSPPVENNTKVSDVQPPVEAVPPVDEQVAQVTPDLAPVADSPATTQTQGAEEEVVVPEELPQPTPRDLTSDTAPIQASIIPTMDSLSLPVPEEKRESPFVLDEDTSYIATEEESLLPLLLPSFSELSKRIQFSSEEEKLEKVRELVDRVGDAYLRGVVLTGEPVADEKRQQAIEKAKFVKIPAVSRSGGILKNREGQVQYAKVIPLNGNINNKLIRTFELADNPTGVYHFFNTDDPSEGPKRLDLNTQINKLVSPLNTFGQGLPFVSFFAKAETSEGGGATFQKTMKIAEINSPAKRLYYLRQNAGDGRFQPITTNRMGATAKDVGPNFLNFGLTLNDLRADWSVGGLFYMQALVYDALQHSEIGGGPAFTLAQSAPSVFDPEIMKFYSPVLAKAADWWQIQPYFTTTAQRFAKEYGVTKEEAEGVFNYSPDAIFTGTKFATEATATAPAVYLAAKLMRKNIFGQFSTFGLAYIANKYPEIAKKYKNATVDWKDLSSALDEAGLDLRQVYKLFIEQQRKGKSSEFIERSLAIDFASRGQVKVAKEFIQARVDNINKKIGNVKAEIDELENVKIPDETTDELLRLKVQELNFLKRDINESTLEAFTNKDTVEFFKDEVLAVTAASLAYQAMMEIKPGDTAAAGMGSFFAVIASLVSPVRTRVQYTLEDMKWGLKMLNPLDGDPPSRHSIQLRRIIEKAPPELRDQIIAHTESRIRMNGELQKIVVTDPSNPNFGKPVISKESLNTSFSGLGTLLSLENLEQQALQTSLNIRKDMGKLSKKFAQVEKLQQDQVVALDEMADAILELRNYKVSDAYDPSSEIGNHVDIILDLYDKKRKAIDFKRKQLEVATTGVAETVDSLVDGIGVEQNIGEFLSGELDIREYIAHELLKYRMYEIPEDADLATEARLLQNHLVELQTRFVKAAETVNIVRGAQQSRGTANNQAMRLLVQAEHSAYLDMGHQFRALREQFSDAKFNITAYTENVDGESVSIFEQIVDGDIELDENIVEMIPIRRQGTAESRKVLGIDFKPELINKLDAVFGSAADEYFETLQIDPAQAEAVSGILSDLKLTNAPSIVQFIGLRRLALRTVRKRQEDVDALDADSLSDDIETATSNLENAQNALPKLGLGVDEYMHLVSSLGARAKKQQGKPGAIPIAQLRERLLEDGKTQFVRYLDDPTRPEERVDFGTPYESARDYARKIYYNPWRNANTGIKRYLAKPGTSEDELDGLKLSQATDLFAFERILKSVGFDRRLTEVEIEEGANTLLKSLNRGKEYDLSNPNDIGAQQLRVILTQYALETVASFSGGKELAKIASGKLYNRRMQPQRAQELAQAEIDLLEGRVTGESNILLSNLYALKDKNGVPFVDQSMVDYTNSLEHVEKFLPQLVEKAKLDVTARKQRFVEKKLAKFDDVNSAESKQLELSQQLTTRLKSEEGGLGAGLVKMINSENGRVNFETMREAYIEAQSKLVPPVPEDVARYNFNTTVRQATMQHIFDSVMVPQQNKVLTRYDAKGNKVREVVRAKQINGDKLFDMLGFVGDTVPEYNTYKTEGLKLLLRDETLENPDEIYEQAIRVANSVFKPKIKSPFNVVGISMPVSAESKLSKITSYLRGVISLRWLITEAAIRESMSSQMELTKILLFNPKVGKELLDIMETEKFDLKRFERIEEVLLNEIARNEAIQQVIINKQETKPEEDTPEEADTTNTFINRVGQQVSNLFN